MLRRGRLAALTGEDEVTVERLVALITGLEREPDGDAPSTADRDWKVLA